ncbi:MAG: hypothetical protein SGPRY_001668, partial [Prymnesium sp.]
KPGGREKSADPHSQKRGSTGGLGGSGEAGEEREKGADPHSHKRVGKFGSGRLRRSDVVGVEREKDADPQSGKRRSNSMPGVSGGLGQEGEEREKGTDRHSQKRGEAGPLGWLAGTFSGFGQKPGGREKSADPHSQKRRSTGGLGGSGEAGEEREKDADPHAQKRGGAFVSGGLGEVGEDGVESEKGADPHSHERGGAFVSGGLGGLDEEGEEGERDVDPHLYKRAASSWLAYGLELCELDLSAEEEASLGAQSRAARRAAWLLSSRFGEGCGGGGQTEEGLDPHGGRGGVGRPLGAGGEGVEEAEQEAFCSGVGRKIEGERGSLSGAAGGAGEEEAAVSVHGRRKPGPPLGGVAEGEAARADVELACEMVSQRKPGAGGGVGSSGWVGMEEEEGASAQGARRVAREGVGVVEGFTSGAEEEQVAGAVGRRLARPLVGGVGGAAGEGTEVEGELQGGGGSSQLRGTCASGVGGDEVEAAAGSQRKRASGGPGLQGDVIREREEMQDEAFAEARRPHPIQPGSPDGPALPLLGAGQLTSLDRLISDLNSWGTEGPLVHNIEAVVGHMRSPAPVSAEDLNAASLGLDKARLLLGQGVSHLPDALGEDVLENLLLLRKLLATHRGGRAASSPMLTSLDDLISQLEGGSSAEGSPTAAQLVNQANNYLNQNESIRMAELEAALEKVKLSRELLDTNKSTLRPAQLAHAKEDLQGIREVLETRLMRRMSFSPPLTFPPLPPGAPASAHQEAQRQRKGSCSNQVGQRIAQAEEEHRLAEERLKKERGARRNSPIGSYMAEPLQRPDSIVKMHPTTPTKYTCQK